MKREGSLTVWYFITNETVKTKKEGLRLKYWTMITETRDSTTSVPDGTSATLYLEFVSRVDCVSEN